MFLFFTCRGSQQPLEVAAEKLENGGVISIVVLGSTVSVNINVLMKQHVSLKLMVTAFLICSGLVCDASVQLF